MKADEHARDEGQNAIVFIIIHPRCPFVLKFAFFARAQQAKTFYSR